MTKLFSNYKRAAIDFASAQGNYLTDTDGKTFRESLASHFIYCFIVNRKLWLFL